MNNKNRFIVSLVLTMGLATISTPIIAGPLGSGIGGAIIGGVLGDIVGGRDGAAWGATIGAGVGATRGARRQVAERDHYDRRDWERRRSYEQERMSRSRYDRFEDRRYDPCRR
jgi:uncharacterized protein YcfJ